MASETKTFNRQWETAVKAQFLKKAIPLLTSYLQNCPDRIPITDLDQRLANEIEQLSFIFMKALQGGFKKQINQIIANCMPLARSKKYRKGRGKQGKKHEKKDRKNAVDSIHLFTQHSFITAKKTDCFCHVEGRSCVGQNGLHEWSSARQKTRGYICTNNPHGFCTESCIFTPEYIERFTVALKAMKCAQTKSGFSIYDVMGEFGVSLIPSQPSETHEILNPPEKSDTIKYKMSSESKLVTPVTNSISSGMSGMSGMSGISGTFSERLSNTSFASVAVVFI